MKIIDKIAFTYGRMVGKVIGNILINQIKKDISNEPLKFSNKKHKEDISFEQIKKNEEDEEMQDQIDFFRKEIVKELVKFSYPETHTIMENCYVDMIDLNRDFILEGQRNWADRRDIARKKLEGEALSKATIRVYEYQKTYHEDLSSYVGLYQSDNIAWGYLKLKMEKETERLMNSLIHTADVEKNFPHIEILLPFASIVRPKSPEAIKNILSKREEWKNLTVTEAFNDKGENKERYEAIFDELNLEYFKYKKKLKEYVRMLCSKVNKYKVIFNENMKQDGIYKSLYETTISDLPTEIIKSRLQVYHNPKNKLYHKHGNSSSLMFYDDFEERRFEIIEDKRRQEEEDENKD